MIKKTYPNYVENISPGPSYNLNKWMDAMKDIYVKLHLGASKKDAVSLITNDWNILERNEFLNWLRYYESGDHKKYKKAQNSYYVNDDINYFLPNPKHNIPNPIRSVNEQIASIPQEASDAVNHKNEELKKEDRKKLIEDQRKKILGRLNSARKLLSSQQGQVFAGPDFEKLLSAIYEIEKQVQMINRSASISTQTIIDLVIRQSNILKKQGYKNASEFMIKFAQNTPGDFSMQLGTTPAGGSQPQGLGGLDNITPDLTMPEGGPQLESDDLTEDSAVGKFIKNLEDSGLSNDEDDNTVDDEVVIEDDILFDQEIFPKEDELKTEAQAAAPGTLPSKPAPKETIEVEEPIKSNELGMTTEEAQRGPSIPQVKNDFDAIIDSAFASLKIEDVIKKLEEVSVIFKNRELGRQLALVDYMLSKLGLASYFGSIGEAISKNLESNQYCLTRIEDISSKLRGAATISDISLKPNDIQQSPEVQQVKNNLEQADKKEKERKDIRKQLQDKETMEAIKPELEVESPATELAAQPPKPETIEVPPAPATPAR